MVGWVYLRKRGGWVGVVILTLLHSKHPLPRPYGTTHYMAYRSNFVTLEWKVASWFSEDLVDLFTYLTKNTFTLSFYVSINFPLTLSHDNITSVFHIDVPNIAHLVYLFTVRNPLTDGMRNEERIITNRTYIVRMYSVPNLASADRNYKTNLTRSKPLFLTSYSFYARW
jgi:hypothetical protein